MTWDTMRRGTSREALQGVKLEARAVEDLGTYYSWKRSDFLRNVYIPDRTTGIKYDLFHPDSRSVIWVTHLGERQRVTNKHVQRMLGELLFLKNVDPKSRSIVLIYQMENFASYAEDFFALFWDSALFVDNSGIVRNLTEFDRNGRRALHSMRDLRSSRETARSILAREVEESRRRQNYWANSSKNYERTTHAPTTKQLVVRKLKDGSWKNGSAPLDEAIRLSYQKAPRYIKEKINREKWEYFESPTHTITWLHFNPLEALVSIKLEGIGHRWLGSKDIEVRSFLADLHVRHPVEEEVVLPNLHIQAKTLATPEGGVKNAKNDVRRMAARAFLVRWGIKGDQIVKTGIETVALLDGYWTGPRQDPQQNIRFLVTIGGIHMVFFPDELDELKSYVRRRLESRNRDGESILLHFVDDKAS